MMKTKVSLMFALIIAVMAVVNIFGPASRANNGKYQKDGSASTQLSVKTTKNDRVSVATLAWQTIVNNEDLMPNTNSNFSSYGQPSVNSEGVVVFRGRSTGGEHETGIYMRLSMDHEIQPIADTKLYVPQPNNLNTVFTEFPSIPRISVNSANVATRGNHKPVYTYVLPDGTETRVGNTGIYAQLGNDLLQTGASKLGNVPGFEYFAVPNIVPALQFDVFPGSPAITDDGTIIFKGNYTQDGVGKTGIFYRRVNTPGGGNLPVEVIASSDTQIPNLPQSLLLTFDSTAPPSAAGTEIAFVGLDNEDDPHFGGIYVAPIEPSPQLRPIAEIGKGLPGLTVPELTRIGEGLSFDGRYLAFWAAWGNETKTVRLYCPVDGNKGLIAYCNGVDPNSIFDNETEQWFQEMDVHVNQGIFVYDLLAETAYLVADSTTNFNDFVFWGYSGKAPGTGSEEDAEPPRWRAASFVSVSNGLTAFKARTGVLDANNVYTNPIDGIYMRNAPRNKRLQLVAETGMAGDLLDSSLKRIDMPITGIGIERDGFRGEYLAITATMANAEDSWGGVYLARVPLIRSGSGLR